jgi:hypothetical protein
MFEEIFPHEGVVTLRSKLNLLQWLLAIPKSMHLRVVPRQVAVFVHIERDDVTKRNLQSEDSAAWRSSPLSRAARTSPLRCMRTRASYVLNGVLPVGRPSTNGRCRE